MYPFFLCHLLLWRLFKITKETSYSGYKVNSGFVVQFERERPKVAVRCYTVSSNNIGAPVPVGVMRVRLCRMCPIMVEVQRSHDQEACWWRRAFLKCRRPISIHSTVTPADHIIKNISYSHVGLHIALAAGGYICTHRYTSVNPREHVSH